MTALHDSIMTFLMHKGVSGTTVFLGLEGYGETAELHKAHLVHSDRPVVITIIDTAETIERLVPVAAEMIGTGLMAASDVQMIRRTPLPMAGLAIEVHSGFQFPGTSVGS